MGLKTIPFRDLEDKADNMYEVVSAMSSQAKLELQERLLNKAISTHQEEELDVFDEIEEITPANYVEEKKVTSVAVDKFIDGDVTWRKSTIE
ncbi:MAG: hypothetical protein CMG60_03720 [Candidatus Marinimicrobia bacterium]|nr:hypothetical protein [Candidatus Neomarinimicrobiota bacterium]